MEHRRTTRGNPARLTTGFGVASCTGVQAYRRGMTISPMPSDWVPDACTLPTVEQPIRVAEFDRFFADSVRDIRRPGLTRLELVLTGDAEPVARDLAARETSCCSFFTFDFTATGESSVMGVGVPATYVEVLDAFAARVQAGIGGGW